MRYIKKPSTVKVRESVLRGLSISNNKSWEEQKKVFSQLDLKSRKALDDLRIKMSREQIFAFKFKGAKLTNNDIFKGLQSFSPTAKPKKMPITPLNLVKFQ